jgi:hypothetical protein
MMTLDGWSRTDAVLALALFTVWAARTGRNLRPVPLSELTAEELITFWADDQVGYPVGEPLVGPKGW